jgi:hypothetical protein
MTRRYLALLGAIILLVAIYCGLMWMLLQPAPKPTRPPEWSPAEKGWVIHRMQVHGIWGCECDGNNCYFYRNGKKCPL